jgi:hypothetical protein
MDPEYVRLVNMGVAREMDEIAHKSTPAVLAFPIVRRGRRRALG